MKRQRDDKGFTLVEVIIAVVILGVAFGPVLSDFMQSARVNRMAREKLAATTMAQNIMEGISAYKSEDLIKSFETYDPDNPDYVGMDMPVLSVLPTGVRCDEFGERRTDTNDPFRVNVDGIQGEDPIYGSVQPKIIKTTKQDGTVLERTMYTPSEIFIQDNHKYQYYIKNVRSQINSNDKNGYDLLVTVDGSAHRKDPHAWGAEEKKNDIAGVNISSVDNTYDCIWADTASDLTDVIQNQLRQNCLDGGASYMQLMNFYKRELTVKIYDKDTNADDDVHDYNVDFINTYSSKMDYYPNYDFGSYTQTVNGYSSLVTGRNPRNIYVYYWPNYTTDYRFKDKITIENTAGIKVDVILVRMDVPQIVLPGSASLKATTEANENNYQMDLKIYADYTKMEGLDFTGIPNSDSGYERLRNNLMTIQTNVYENIAFKHAENVALAKSGNTSNLHNDLRGNITMDSEYFDAASHAISLNDEPDKLKAMIVNLYGMVLQDKIYNVKVDVYEMGAADDDFPEEKLLATFDGSVTD
ncbi:MAG: type II secretion system protein [Lachnospiraceae bacterium]|jgi:prepilin-type N-terminal cleavage/methylation domain-containing protein|nr:type II secretion system protein [Lachnospiraceae bacterium]